MQDANDPDARLAIPPPGQRAYLRSAGPHSAARLALSDAGFFLTAGVACLVARLERKSHLTLLVDDAFVTIQVDLSGSFSRVLATVHAGLCANEDDGAIADAAVFLWKEPSAQPGPHPEPSFHLRTPSSARGTLILTAPEWLPERCERILLYLATLLESAAQDGEQTIETLPLTTEAEALALYGNLNATSFAFPNTSLLEMISEQANIDPSAEAVVFGGHFLTYSRLEIESARLANVFAGMGANQTRPVALCIPRSEQLSIILLAALKAGSFFVPLDPSHPRQRLMDILDECKPAVVVVTSSTAQTLAGGILPLFLLDGQEQSSGYTEAIGQSSVTSSPDDTAYMIYTSGTTGRPKGVMVSHGSLMNFLLHASREPGLKRGERWLAVATISFDMSMMDMFLPLVSGATLVIASEQDAIDPRNLASLLEDERIDCMQATPTQWRMLIAQGWQGKAGLRMLAGGEILPRDLANTLLGLANERGPAVLWNCYGPTETTIYSSFLRITMADDSVALGGPIANTSFYIADVACRLVPPDVPGELYIGGAGVAKGYFERPRLNDEKFVPDDWSTHSTQRLFRTGDGACFRPDGTLDFFGRLDSQIKLRGFRIELGEIESVLRKHTAISDAAVVLREDIAGAPWLVAYLVASRGANENGDIESNAESFKELRAHCARSLPAYMLPSRWVFLAELPVTGSGKINARALQQLPLALENEVEPSFAVSGAFDMVEASLLRIFREVLRSPGFGVDDSFFDHGGYSLLAVRLFARIARDTGSELPITALFDAPTVRSLAALLRSSESMATVVPIRAGGKGAPFFMVQSYLLYGLAGQLISDNRRVYGLRESTSRSTALAEHVTACVEAIGRIYPQGIVHLGGWCAAATATVEIGRKLQRQGRTVGVVALFDAEASGFVAIPPVGNARLARTRAALAYHVQRLRKADWQERFEYLAQRGSQNWSDSVEWWTALRLRAGLLLHRPSLVNARNARHELAPVDLKISLFRAIDVVTVPGSDETLGWNTIAMGGVDVTFVPGHHESMFHEPHLGVLREQLERAMADAEQDAMHAVKHDLAS